MRLALRCLLFLFTGFSIVVGSAPAKTIDLVILHINDTHGKLYPRNTKDRTDIGGIGRLSTMVSDIRESHAGPVMFLHAGDMFSRGAPATIYSGGLVNLLAFEQMGVDVTTPGNGEFYFGIGNLEEKVSRVRTPFVHANVTYKLSGATIFPPYVIKEIEGIRVGILGLGLIRLWHHSSSVLTLHDPVETAMRFAPEIRPQVDLFVALTHIGARRDSLVAKAVPELDLIVGGDSHTKLDQPSRIPRPNGAGSVAIVQARHYYAYLGRVDLRLESTSGGRFRVSKVDGKLLPITADVSSDPAIDRIVARFEEPLQEVIALTETDLTDAPNRQLPMGDLVAEAVRQQTRADVAIVGANNDTTGFTAGEIRLADVVRIRQYRTSILMARMTTDQIRTVLTKRFYLTAGCRFARSDSVVRDLVIEAATPEVDGTYLVALSKQVAFRSRNELNDVVYDDSGQRVDTAIERYLRTIKVVH